MPASFFSWTRFSIYLLLILGTLGVAGFVLTKQEVPDEPALHEYGEYWVLTVGKPVFYKAWIVEHNILGLNSPYRIRETYRHEWVPVNLAINVTAVLVSSGLIAWIIERDRSWLAKNRYEDELKWRA
jgi:hypothetical protein